MLLWRLPVDVVTLTSPELAPGGTTAVKYVFETTLKEADVPLKETLVVVLNPCPRIPTVVPTTPVEDTRPTKDGG